MEKANLIVNKINKADLIVNIKILNPILPTYFTKRD